MLSEHVKSPPTPHIPPPNHTNRSPRKKGHRKRNSALRLSSDTSATTSTLPEYTQGTRHWHADLIPEDSPPDYPGHRDSESAEEADEETELAGSDPDGDDQEEYNSEGNKQGPFTYVSQYTPPRHPLSKRLTPTGSPRHSKKFLHQQLAAASARDHKRRHSSVSVTSSSATGQYQQAHKKSSSLSTPASPFKPPTSAKSRLSQSQTERDTDSYLDSLLERSVYALEMSNTLLQSSMSTQATMSALFSGSSTSLGAFKSPTSHPQSRYNSHDSPADSTYEESPSRGYSGYHDVDSALEARAIGLSSKLMRNWDVQEGWAEELQRIKDGVDSLFNDDDGRQPKSGPVPIRPTSQQSKHLRIPSHSLPSSSPLSSLQLTNTASSSPNKYRTDIFNDDYSQVFQDAEQISDYEEGRYGREEEVSSARLRLGPQGRSNLVSQPPRALTIYVDATSSRSTPNLQESNHTQHSITLPSTLGMRPASASTTSLLLPPAVASTSTAGTVLPPQISDIAHPPSTPAYNMLSSLVARGVHPGTLASTNTLFSGSIPNSLTVPIPSRKNPDDPVPSSAPSSFVSSFISRTAAGLKRRSSSPSSGTAPQPRRSSSADRTTSLSFRRSPHIHPSGISIPSNGSNAQGHSPNPLYIRRMTPPTEEETQTDESSSDGCMAKRTVISLRKILDEQASAASHASGDGSTSRTLLSPYASSSKAASCPNTRPPSESSRSPSVDPFIQRPISARPPPAFMPRTPAPTPSAGTSTATASISKLFTKGVHSSSTRPRSPPLRSNIKGKAPRLAPSEQSPEPESPSAVHLTAAAANLSGQNSRIPSPSPSFAQFPEFVTRALANGNSRSASSSGQSTPKRISFARLPESYASTKPEGEAGSVFQQRKAASARRKEHQRGRSGSDSGGMGLRRPDSSDAEGDRRWWSNWLAPKYAVDERETRERMYQEDRATRSWGGRMGLGFGGMGHPGMDEWGV
ncbi:hypothetical protein FA15DRAFT_671660 [Coprinopsis marcescibilis]|uniref:Uncharacterized protein n=1 Tax=Coprinopsis marcescibilis TaxID=230819 RepID=A0A5C3KPD5_COPMA|nr:hypothetical protein FA15DRAFT_671660 [Coprinopsis marcescibilis]